MAITPFSAVPSRATGQDTFSADVETFWGQLPTFVNEVNEFGAGLSSQITTSSTTSLLVGTGSKTLTVGTGLGFQVGYPVRIAYSNSTHMTGTVTSYNPTTGALICNIATVSGSGTYAVWKVYAIPASITNVPDGDKGDIVVSLNGTVWTIDAGLLVPSGAVQFFARNTAPSGWLKANGALVSRTTYSDLFSAIGTTFGVGDGSTTFALPDLRGEFIRGWDDARGIDASRVFGSSQLDSFQGHRHTLTDAGGTAVTIQVSASAGSGSTGKYTVAGTPNDLARTEVTNGTNGTPRVGSETRPRNVALLACIKY